MPLFCELYVAFILLFMPEYDAVGYTIVGRLLPIYLYLPRVIYLLFLFRVDCCNLNESILHILANILTRFPWNEMGG